MRKVGVMLLFSLMICCLLVAVKATSAHSTHSTKAPLRKRITGIQGELQVAIHNRPYFMMRRFARGRLESHVSDPDSLAKWWR